MPPDPAEPVPTSSRHRAASRHRPRGGGHTPALYRACDGVTEALLYAMVIFSPWAFGTTTGWAISGMNAAGYLLGLLLLVKWLVRWHDGYRPPRWGDADPETPAPAAGTQARGWARRLTRWLAALTVLVVLYPLTSALNARATFNARTEHFTYQEAVRWLPSSYDQVRTWQAFWQILALALAFWAARDWLLGKTRHERRLRTRDDETGRGTADAGSSAKPGPADPDAESSDLARPYRLPTRLRRLLWVLCLNGGLLAMEGIAQRLHGTNKLLWLVEPRFNRVNDGQFGPFAYRSNAAQYFNLVWPVCLGLWWTLHQRAQLNPKRRHRVGEGPHLVLLPCAVLTAVCPFLAGSRASALAALPMGLAAGVVFWRAGRGRRRHHRWGLLVLASIILALGGYLGWPILKKRLTIAERLQQRAPAGLNQGPLTARLQASDRPARLDRSKVLLALSPQADAVSAAGALLCSVYTNGMLTIRFHSASATNYVQKIVTNFLDRFATTNLDLVIVKDTNLWLFANGTEIPTREGGTRDGPAWDEPVDALWLWNANPQTSSPWWDYPLTRVDLFDRALTADEVAALPRGPSPDLAAQPAPLLSVRLGAQPFNWRDYLERGSSGRAEIYRNARPILRDFPWLGTGPGTFGAVYSLYRSDAVRPEEWAAYAHDDWLEFRITFGRVGFGLILGLLLLVPALWRLSAGLALNRVLISMLVLSLAGCLAQAKVDLPFQTYSLVFLFLLLCAIVVSGGEVGDGRG